MYPLSNHYGFIIGLLHFKQRILLKMTLIYLQKDTISSFLLEYGYFCLNQHYMGYTLQTSTSENGLFTSNCLQKLTDLPMIKSKGYSSVHLQPLQQSGRLLYQSTYTLGLPSFGPFFPWPPIHSLIVVLRFPSLDFHFILCLIKISSQFLANISSLGIVSNQICTS